MLSLPHLASARVLIVEDEPLILMDCETILRDIGVRQIVGVTTAKDALTAMEQHGGFDLAILDVSLQDSSSLPLADILGARGVITGFMSGYGIDDLPQHFRDRPYVAKPFVPSQLAAMLTLMCEKLASTPFTADGAVRAGTSHETARCQGK